MECCSIMILISFYVERKSFNDEVMRHCTGAWLRVS